MPHIAVATGLDIFYDRVGSGPPLLLIMGTGLDHSCWNAQLEAYRHDFECIVFDNRGTGRTQAPDEPFSTQMMARDTIALMDALAIESAHVSGLSLGSCIAQETALLQPRRVRSLQLHGTWARTDGYAARKFRAQIRLLEQLDLRSFYDINVLWFMTPDYMARHAEEVPRQIDRIVDAAPRPEILKRQYLADLEHHSLDRLPQIRAPTLVTVGTFDVALPPLYGREVAEAIAGARFVQFQAGGHLHNVEQPEEFNRVTLQFLRDVERRGAAP